MIIGSIFESVFRKICEMGGCPDLTDTIPKIQHDFGVHYRFVKEKEIHVSLTQIAL
jgi:hypothetical protein